jgi:hypothetical protein|tara:strand:- start:576 stop:773 length:198 start_codon:yes stop_codon:yes gene_type:complete
MKTLIIIGISLYLGYAGGQADLQDCICASLPNDYFVEETYEQETCLNKEREIVITRTVRQAKVEK